jgi:hypothetical protein
MKSQIDDHDTDMPEEIDFSGGVRGKHAAYAEQITRSVMLAPDMAEIFPDAESVNAALRAVVEAARQMKEPGTR